MADLPTSDEIIKHLNGFGFQVKDWFDHPAGGAQCKVRHSWLPWMRFSLASNDAPKTIAHAVAQDYVLTVQKKAADLGDRCRDDRAIVLCVEKEGP
jgi:hypothetical protein